MRGSTPILAALSLCLLLALAVPAATAATTELQIKKIAADGITIINEKTVDYRWLEANLPVQGDGRTHYYHQGPVFEGDPWNPEEDTNVLEKDMGAVKGTDLKDICELVGGMGKEDTVRVRAVDGMSKIFPYRNVYEPESRQGPMVVTWYRAEDGYVPDYHTGMRLVFFADTSTNPYGNHTFGIWDMHECFDEEYWYFFQPNLPTTTGLSVQYVSEITIYSEEEPTGSIYVNSTPRGAAVYIDDEKAEGVTPCTLSGIEVGSRAVRVELEGFVLPDEKWVTVVANAVAEVDFNLTAETGSIAVSSVPTNASIYLDGNATGAWTDTVLEAVPVGEHTVELVMPGYRNATRTVTVEEDGHVALDLVLSPAGEKAEANITAPGETTPKRAAPANPIEGFIEAILAFLGNLFGIGGGTATPPEPESTQATAGHATTPVPTDIPVIPVQEALSTKNHSGGLYVDSYPPGMTIVVDNKKLVWKTPHAIYGLREGLHTITVEEGDPDRKTEDTGYRFEAIQAWVYPDAVAPAFLDGLTTRNKKTIRIDSNTCRGERFTVNGFFLAGTIPGDAGVEGTKSWVTVLWNGTYISYGIPYAIEEGGTFTVEPREGDNVPVSVDSNPPGAAVFIDGFSTGKVTPCRVDGLSPGQHRILVSKTGYIPAGDVVTIPEGARTGGTITCTLREYVSGDLLVESTVPDAKIYLYGRYTGEKAPHTFTGMSIGTYEVRAVSENASRTVEDVLVTPGETTLCRVVLEE